MKSLAKSLSRPAVVLVLIFAATGLDARELPAQALPPPLAGQPPNFSGAIGRFRITASASPTDVEAEESIRFTIRIAGEGQVEKTPGRPNLQRLAAFRESFVVADLPDIPAGPSGPWEFAYRLRPRSAQIRAIPSVFFSYYRPGILPPEKGYWTIQSNRVTIRVRPRQPIQAAAVLNPGGLSAPPPSVLDGSIDPEAVLRMEKPPVLALSWAVIALLLPAIGAFFAWTALIFHPLLGRPIQHLRLSIARWQALRQINDAERANTREVLPRLSGTVEKLLRYRPGKAGEGMAAPLQGGIHDFEEICAVLRYAAAPPSSSLAIEAARRIVKEI